MLQIVESYHSGPLVSPPQAELQEADPWRPVTPLEAGLAHKRDPPSMYKRASVKNNIESHIRNIEEEFDNGEGVKDELEKKILSVEEELKVFH